MNERTKQVTEFENNNVSFLPDIMLFDDKIVDKLYKFWNKNGRKKDVSITFKLMENRSVNNIEFMAR